MKKKSNSTITNFVSIIFGIFFLSFFLFNILGFLDNLKENAFFWTLEGFGLEGNILSITSLILGVFFIYPIFKSKK